MARYQPKPTGPVEAMQWTGDNIDAIWEWGGTAGIYGPTETNPGTLLLTTIDGEQVPCRVGHWVMAEPVPDRFYPCDPEVFASRYESESAPIELHDVARLKLQHDDTLVVRINAAQENQAMLGRLIEEWHPGVRVLFLPLEATVAVMHGK